MGSERTGNRLGECAASRQVGQFVGSPDAGSAAFADTCGLSDEDTRRVTATEELERAGGGERRLSSTDRLRIGMSATRHTSALISASACSW